MDFCLSNRLSPRYLTQATEIKVKYRDRAVIPDLIQKYPNKTIILSPHEPGDANYDWNELRRYSLMCQSNFIMNLNHMLFVNEAKENNIKFMLNTEATSYWELRGLEELGAEYAYVGIPLFFDLKHSLDMDIKLRAIPTVAYNHILPHSSGVYGQWIRPEDVDKYEGYIQILEFEPCNIQREQTLFNVYAIDKSWNTRLDILVEDLGSNAVNRLIPSEITEARLNCRQVCQSGGNCHMCYTALKLANPDLLTKIKNSNIEK